MDWLTTPYVLCFCDLTYCDVFYLPMWHYHQPIYLLVCDLPILVFTTYLCFLMTNLCFVNFMTYLSSCFLPTYLWDFLPTRLWYFLPTYLLWYLLHNYLPIHGIFYLPICGIFYLPTCGISYLCAIVRFHLWGNFMETFPIETIVCYWFELGCARGKTHYTMLSEWASEQVAS
jgi:hypothetical protein